MWNFHELSSSILAAALPAAWQTAEELYVVLPGDKIPGPESNLPGQRWPVAWLAACGLFQSTCL